MKMEIKISEKSRKEKRKKWIQPNCFSLLSNSMNGIFVVYIALLMKTHKLQVFFPNRPKEYSHLYYRPSVPKLTNFITTIAPPTVDKGHIMYLHTLWNIKTYLLYFLLQYNYYLAQCGKIYQSCLIPRRYNDLSHCVLPDFFQIELS